LTGIRLITGLWWRGKQVIASFLWFFAGVHVGAYITMFEELTETERKGGLLLSTILVGCAAFVSALV
jgi:hypothetical protein